MRPTIPILALAAAVCLPACSSCNDRSAGVLEAGAAVVEPPVPAPDGLLAEGWIRTPDATWSRVQQGVSGAVALLPPAVGDLACAFAGLDPHLSPLVDGKATSYFALADAGGGDVAWAVALPLTDATTATAVLLDASDGQPSRYAAREEGGMRVLVARERPLDAAVAIAQSRLVIARSDQDLARLGPYVTRTMPTRAAPASTASIVAMSPHSALAGPLSSWLGAAWGNARGWLAARDDEQRAQHGGRAPDFGDPRAIVAALDAVVKRRLAFVADAQSARLELDAQDDDVRADLFVTPGEEAGAGLVASMRPGDAKPLADAPGDGLVAILLRDDVAAREEDARDVEAALDRTLGARLREDDARALHAAIDHWSRARGDWMTAGIAWDVAAPVRGLWLRTPSGSGDAAAQSVRELVELTRRPPLDDLLAGSLRLGPPTVAPAEVPGLGKATLATFPPPVHQVKPGKAPGNVDEPLGVAWAAHGSDLLVAMGQGASRLLSSQASPARRLGDDARNNRLLSALGSAVTFALLAQPLRLDPARPGQDAPALLAWGRREGEAWVRVEIADALLRELIRLKAGL